MNAEVGFKGTYCRANNTFQDLVLTLQYKIQNQNEKLKHKFQQHSFQLICMLRPNSS